MRSLGFFALLVTIHSAAAGSPHSSAGTVVWAIPEALHVIRAADRVSICSVVLTEDRDHFVTAHRINKYSKPLGADDSRKLRRLLGTESNWFHGIDDTASVGYPPKDVGFIFRKGQNEVVLLCGLGSRLEGTVNGEPTNGTLEDKASVTLDKWKKQYAQRETLTK
jgi:hypothetical protein